LAGFARWCFVHRKAVLAGWLIALIGFFAIGQKVGANYAENDSLPGTDSTQALSVLRKDYPAQAGDSDQIVVQAKHGTLRSPAAETAVTSMLARVARLPHVRSVASPYGPGGQISQDGTIGLATVNLDAQAASIPNAAVQTIVSTAQSADGSLLNVQPGGAAVENVAVPSGDYTSVILGIVLALAVLFVAFQRSVLAALLPLISALVAIGAGLSIINVLTHAISVASWVPEVAVIVALGVGVDYALFIVSRHRNGLLAGQTPEDAAVTALNTSGRAVLLAGLTVSVALLGLFALQVSSLYGVAVTVVVGLTMVASLTLLPAMLGFLGPKVLRRAERRMLAAQGRQVEQAGDAATTTLLDRLRAGVPQAEAGSTLAIHIGGTTAASEDYFQVTSSKLPQFVTVVVGLSFLLLAVVFRSLLIPLVASIMNVLSFGVALGVMTAAFQFGWGKSVLGFGAAGPIEAWIPR